MDSVKTCSKCGKVKPLISFKPKGNQCRSCLNAYSRAYFLTDKGKASKLKFENSPSRKLYMQRYHKKYYKTYKPLPQNKAAKLEVNASERGSRYRLASELSIPAWSLPSDFVKLYHQNVLLKRELKK